MRSRLILSIAALVFAAPLLGQPQQSQQQSVAEAARKAREKRKAAQQAQPKKVLTNEDLQPGTSTTTAQTEPPAETSTAGAVAGGASAGSPAEVERDWRKRFADMRQKIAEAEKEVEILQRELGKNQVQYYPDPQKTLQQETFRTDINETRKKIEAKRKEVADLKQAMEDLERELRAAGHPPGWARP